MIRTKNYILSPTIIFVVIGFLLLLGVIFLHDTINNGVSSQSILGKIFPISLAETKTSPAMPNYIVNEVINSGVNIAGTVDSCANRPTEVSRLICQSNRDKQAKTFITQE